MGTKLAIYATFFTEEMKQASLLLMIHSKFGHRSVSVQLIVSRSPCLMQAQLNCLVHCMAVEG